MDDLMKTDLYELLDISINADEKEIKKAYRKKALTCHPDKNPDNPKAAELFQELSKALKILTDVAARSAYDKVLNARKAAQLRNKELDSKRKKLKEDLEAREKRAQEIEESQRSAERLQKEIERLREEGSRQLEEENELLRQQIERERLGLNKVETQEAPRLKVKWKSHKNQEDNGGYNQEVLNNIFQKYGQVTCLVSSRKKGSGIVEFSSSEAAQQAYESEKGLPENPLTLSWICGQPSIPRNSPLNNTNQPNQPVPDLGSDTVLTHRDYESLVLMKLRQAEERKKLIQQMIEEEDK